MSSGSFAEALGAVARRRAAGGAGPPAPPVRAPVRPDVPAAEATPPGPLDFEGVRCERAGGREVCVIERDAAELLPGVPLLDELDRALETLALTPEDTRDRGLAPAAGMSAADLVFLDLETLGFWGCPVVLACALVAEGGRLVSRQFLARDFPEEPAVLAATAELLASRRALVTFNGKSYDAPCLAERAAAHGVPLALGRLAHVDVLHPARRRWRESLPDCRLQTLERHVAGFTRSGDLPSSEVPAAWYEFARTRDPERLRPVLHHGRVDVLTTARLFAALALGPDPAAG